MVKTIIWLSLPTSFSGFVSILFEVINLIYIGKLKNKEMLAGVGLGNLFYNIIGIGVIGGFNNALDTLVSQAVGAK